MAMIAGHMIASGAAYDACKLIVLLITDFLKKFPDIGRASLSESSITLVIFQHLSDLFRTGERSGLLRRRHMWRTSR